MDYIIIKTKNGVNKKYFRCFCSICNKDRGYQEKKAINRTCQSCKHLLIDKDSRIRAGKKNKGKKHTPETIETIRSTSTGRKHTKEAKDKMSKKAKESGRKPIREPGFKHSLETKIKSSCSRRGINREQWEDFTTEETALHRAEFKRKGLSQLCFEREAYKCQKCKKQGRLNAHHANSWKFFPEDRYNIDNLICLCNFCHKLFHKIYGNGIKKPNTKEQIEEWIKE